MSMQDPFYIAKEELHQSIQGAVSLYERWKTLLETTNTSTSDEFKWVQNELKTSLRSIEWDLNDLDETVIETNPAKFKLEKTEVASRRTFINESKGKLQQIKDDLGSPKTKAKLDKDSRELLMGQKKNRERVEEAIIQSNQQFVEGQQQQQQMIKQDQDKKLDIIKDNVDKLKQIGTAIDGAIQDHEVLINEMDTEITKADSGLKGTLKRLNQLIDQTKDSTQWGIIIILIVVLVGLLIGVYYVF